MKHSKIAPGGLFHVPEDGSTSSSGHSRNYSTCLSYFQETLLYTNLKAQKEEAMIAEIRLLGKSAPDYISLFIIKDNLQAYKEGQSSRKL